MIVMKYYENRNLHQYLDHPDGILSWRDMIYILWKIAGGLERIHAGGKVHGNLHGGNWFIEDENVSKDAQAQINCMEFFHILRRKFCVAKVIVLLLMYIHS